MKITLGHLTSLLTTLLKNNAPVRGDNVPAGREMPKNYKRVTKYSPYPGNLRNNGITENVGTNSSSVSVGGAAAPYAVYTEKRSFKPGWIANSERQFLDACRKYGGKIK